MRPAPAEGTMTATSSTDTRVPAAPAGLLDRLAPAHVTGWVRATAWASLLANCALIVTGGAVRLTGSGLGCPTWPRCTPGSWTNTPEMGVHGMIEFGNRTLTFVLVAVAVLTFMAMLRLRREHPSFVRFAFWLGIGIIVQAVVGGISVRTGLNPWIVGIHFLLSGVMIAAAAVLLNRVRRASLPRVAEGERAGLFAPERARTARFVALGLAVFGSLAVYLGTLVTGTGPHSGDKDVLTRHTFDAYLMVRLHALPTYALVLVTVTALVLASRQAWPPAIRRMLGILLVLLVLQGAIGYYQWFNGTPVLAAACHMAGAAALMAVLAMTTEKLLHLTRPDARTAPVAPGH